MGLVTASAGFTSMPTSAKLSRTCPESLAFARGNLSESGVAVFDRRPLSLSQPRMRSTVHGTADWECLLKQAASS
jgi:hypothetical protein